MWPQRLSAGRQTPSLGNLCAEPALTSGLRVTNAPFFGNHTLIMMKTLSSRLPRATSAAFLLALLPACKPSTNATNDATKIDFVTSVRPILESRCVNCHHAGALLGNLNLQSRAQAFADRPGGPVILPGEVEKSRLYQVLLLPVEDQKAMPPESHRLPVEELAILKRWISEGAEWPEGADGQVKVLPPLRN
jgi:uncharacterized membrane protein